MKNKSSNFTKKIIIMFVIMFLSIVFLAGCTSGAISYYVTNFPNKMIYQIGETPNFAGLSVETTNSDGTHTMVRLNSEDISKIDTSTSGEKKVKITKGKLSTAFNVYVASVVINDSDDIKAKFLTLKDGDIVYLRAGNYMPKNSDDTSFKDIIVNKSITIIGDGAEKTKFYGNFIVGANSENGNFVKLGNFENVKIMNIGFKLNYKIDDNLMVYDGPYGNSDLNGAIRSFDTKNMLIFGCKFCGYSYGINAENANGLTIQNCSFRWLTKNAIYTSSDTRNTTIFKNIIMDIANNVVSFDKSELSSVGGLELSFAKKGVAGVNICKNTFTRIALHDGAIIYFDNNSKEQAQITKEDLFKLTYINNSAIITLKSSAEDDLEVSGILLSTNNYGQTLTNIRLNTTANNNIDQNGVIVVE